MFKKYASQSFYILLFISTCLYGADHNPEEYSALRPEFRYPPRIDTFDPYGLRAKATARYVESLKPKRTLSDDEFNEMLMHHQTDLPSKEDAEDIVSGLMQEHPDLNFTIPAIKNSDYCAGEHPSRLLFVGPSGCGKTTAAKAIARYCDANCIFVKGSTIGNTYQNSGSVLINNLFNGLLERSEQPFIVIIDEFVAASQFTSDDKDRQQHQTAMALWQALDDCEKKRHICVIGTDNEDPEKLPLTIQTRFAYNIFPFHHTNHPSNILKFMKKNLGYSLDEHDNPCSDEFLTELAQSVNSLSLREINTLLGKCKLLAAHESQNPKAIVTKEHLKKIFTEHRKPTALEKIWIDRDKHFRNLTSARALSIYMMTAGLGLASQNYKCTGLLLGIGGAAINHHWAEGKDLQLFSMLSHLSAQYENHQQWETSHNFNMQNAEETRTARLQDTKRADDSVTWDRIFRLRESLNQLSMELHNVCLQKIDEPKREWILHKLSAHIDYINAELINEYKKVNSQKDDVAKKD